MCKISDFNNNGILHIAKIEVRKCFYIYICNKGTPENGKKLQAHSNFKKV